MSAEKQDPPANASRDWRPLYPFASHFHWHKSVRQHFLDEGPRDAAETLLCVHGNPTWSFYWRNIVQGLRDRCRVVAPDHVGCGLSDKPQNYPYCLSQHIDNLVELVRQLDLKNVTLLAHDWGGAIGLGTVLRLPERFSRIVLFNTAGFPPPFIPKRIQLCRIPLLGTLGVRGFNLFARAALSMATEKPERMTPAVRAGLLAPYDSWSTRVAIDRFVKDIPTSPRQPTWQRLAEIEAGLKSLSHLPRLLIWGMKDWCFTPACLERLLSHWPDAEVDRYEDCGHYVVEDAFERIAPRVAEFLDGK
jgi:haloalkane dehalogenase